MYAIVYTSFTGNLQITLALFVRLLCINEDVDFHQTFQFVESAQVF